MSDERSTIGTWVMPSLQENNGSMRSGPRLLQGMGLAEGVDLHAFLVDPHAGRHAGDVAFEVADGADHLAGEADVGEGRRVAVAKAAGLLLALEMHFDRVQRLQRPVREPPVARRLVELQLLLHIGTD